MPAEALLKKLNRSGGARPPLPGAAAFGPALARGVEDRLRPLLRAPVAVEAASPRALRLAEATADLTFPALTGLVEVQDGGAALVVADYALAWHMTDLTLGGDPGVAPAPLPRVMTAIDLGLGGLHLRAMVEALSAALAVGLGRPLRAPLRLGETRQDLAEVRLGAEGSDAIAIGLSVTIGGAGRRGGAAIVLPLAALDALRAAAPGEAAAEGEERPNDLWRRHMRGAAAAAAVPVEAVLHRQSMSLAAVRGLRVGQVLEIPRASAEAIQLRLAQPGGRAATIATGRLGALDEHKVVKLDVAPDPRLIQHVAGALRLGAGAPPPAPEPQPPALPAVAES